MKRNYSIGESSREEFTEEIVLQISPASKVQLALQWKRLWQHGEALIRGPQSEFVVPYQVVAGMTFDQSLIDV